MISIYDSGADYDRLLLSADTSDEVDFYASLVPPGGTVLELACGTGRLTLLLAERGLKVTGLDNSEAMLVAAEAKAAAYGLATRFVLGNVRQFALDPEFDLIFLPNNSLEQRSLMTPPKSSTRSGITKPKTSRQTFARLIFAFSSPRSLMPC